MAQVSIVKVENGNIKGAVREAVDLLGGMGRFVKKDDLVLLKPNLFVNQPEETGLITSPSVIEAAAMLAKELGARIVIGERTENVYHNLADTDLADIAEIISFDEAPRHDIRIDGARGLYFDVPMPKVVGECDVFISIPGLRTHALTLMSNAMKNLMGLLPRDYTQLVHICGLNESIVDLNMYRPSDLVITDAIIATEGNFPGKAKALPLNLIIAGDNPVAVDAVAAHIIGYQPDGVEHLVDANQRGLGPIDLAEIELKGCDLKPLCDQFEKSHTTISEYAERIPIVAPAICDSCRQALGCGLKQAEEQGLLAEISNIAFVCGPVEKLPEFDSDTQLILYGNCTARWRHHGEYVRGCPPQAGRVVSALRKCLNKE
ncbi:MAG: DUF362 domain-containing protein [Firmicutes bacterium]|nr:DUF362 domain-containing protein [Bacillota bacterium]